MLRQKGKYNQSMDNIVHNASKMGMTVLEICDILDCNKNTFYTWVAKYESLRTAWTQGVEVANKRVEQTLYEQATRGSVTKKIKTTKKGKETIVVEEVIQHPPAGWAIRMWLCNRDKDRWSNAPTFEPLDDLKEVDTQVTITVIPSISTNESN